MTKIADFDLLKLPNVILRKIRPYKMKIWEFLSLANVEFPLKIKIKDL